MLKWQKITARECLVPVANIFSEVSEILNKNGTFDRLEICRFVHRQSSTKCLS